MSFIAVLLKSDFLKVLRMKESAEVTVRITVEKIAAAIIISTRVKAHDPVLLRFSCCRFGADDTELIIDAPI
jgi:hypothetical protein